MLCNIIDVFKNASLQLPMQAGTFGATETETTTNIQVATNTRRTVAPEAMLSPMGRTCDIVNSTSEASSPREHDSVDIERAGEVEKGRNGVGAKQRRRQSGGIGDDHVLCVDEAAKGKKRVYQCGDLNCAKVPSFGVPGKSKREYCARHAKAGMINVITRKCGEVGCLKQASYGVAGTKRRDFCVLHATPGMVNVHWNRCSEPMCSKQAIRPLDGSTRKTLCITHAKLKKSARDYVGRTIVTSEQDIRARNAAGGGGGGGHGVEWDAAQVLLGLSNYPGSPQHIRYFAQCVSTTRRARAEVATGRLKIVSGCILSAV